MNAIVSNHGRKRAVQRLGINKKSVDKLANKVLKEGVRADHLNGNLASWCCERAMKYDMSPKNLYVYNDKLFIFGNASTYNTKVLITVINIHTYIKKPKDKRNKRYNMEQIQEKEYRDYFK